MKEIIQFCLLIVFRDQFFVLSLFRVNLIQMLILFKIVDFKILDVVIEGEVYFIYVLKSNIK